MTGDERALLELIRKVRREPRGLLQEVEGDNQEVPRTGFVVALLRLKTEHYCILYIYENSLYIYIYIHEKTAAVTVCCHKVI